MKLNLQQKEIHERALVVGMKYQIAEVAMIEILQEVEAAGLHKSLGLSCLLKYALKYLKLSEPLALAFIAVARKCKDVPVLKTAICEGKLSASTANRLVSTITKENASELISFATSHTWRETEREIANRNPRAAHPDKVKMLGNGLVQLTITVTEQDYADLQRCSSVEAQRTSSAPTYGRVYSSSIQTHLDKYDPVRKAERAQKRREGKKTEQNRERTDQSQLNKRTQVHSERIPLTAAENHAVQLRDQGRCTHVNEHGVRCNEDRWSDIHHIIPVSRGGSNELSNLATLCWFHHDLAHQMSLAIDGQITWLRSPSTPYGFTG